MTVTNIYRSQESCNPDLIRMRTLMYLDCKGLSCFSASSNPLNKLSWQNVKAQNQCSLLDEQVHGLHINHFGASCD